MPTKKTTQPEVSTEEVTPSVEEIKKQKTKEKKEKAVKQAKKKAEAEVPLTEEVVETAVEDEIIVDTPTNQPANQETDQPTSPKKVHFRGKKYTEARGLVDKTKEYSIPEAIELIKQMSFTKFTGSVEAHLQVKEAGVSATLTFPHSTGKTVRVAIVDEEVLSEIQKGIINFDVLVAKPADMKDLTKFAKVLGPKGLMPNPKNGTLTPNPEAKKKELEAGAVTLKTERKAPLVHTIVGKVDMETKQIAENVESLLKAFVGKTVKLYLCGSMTPSVRVAIEK